MTDEVLELSWYTNDAATFGDRVAAARDAQGMNQKALCKKLGVSMITLEGWENDTAEPRANKLQMLAGVLNVSIPWLLTGDGDGLPNQDSEPTPADLAELMAEMRVLRTQMSQAADRIGILEKRLKLALVEKAA